MSVYSLIRGRATHAPESPAQRIAGIVTTLVLLVLVAVPLAVVVLAAFRTKAPGLPSAYTIDNFSSVMGSSALKLLRNSVIVGVGTTVLALAIGVTLAVILLRTNVIAGKRLDSLIMVPAYMSPFIGAVAWSLLFSPDIGYGTALLRALGLPIFNVYSFAGIIVVMGVYYAPIAYLYVRAMLANIDVSLEESARVFGASPRVTMRVILLPLATPAILSAALLVLVAALGQFGVPGVLGLRVGIDVIPSRIVQLTTNYPSSPTSAAALGVELAVFALVVLWINNLVLSRRDYTTIAPRGGAARAKGRRNVIGTAVVWIYLLLAVVLPIGALVITSFMPYVTTDIGSVSLTLDNYFYVLQKYPTAVRATRNSVLLALAAAVVATALAMMLAHIRYRSQSRLRKPLEYISTLPVAIPHSVVGLAFLWAWLLIPTIVKLPFRVYGTGLILLMLYVALFVPYAARAANSAILQVDKSLEESARVLGASWLAMMRRVSLPLLRPGLLTAAVIVFYHAVRELPASMLVVSPGNEVIATAIWDMYTEGAWVKLFALANVNLVIVFAAVWVMRRFGGSEG